MKENQEMFEKIIDLGTTSIPTLVTQNGQWPLGGWGFEQWLFSVNEVGFLF